MELVAHLTYNEVVVAAAIYLFGMFSGLAVAWKFGRDWIGRD